MDKILLVYEDYADLMNVESTLKKVGFDVIGLSSEYSMAEQILSFNPDVVIGAGRGGKVSSLGVGKRLKEMVRWQGKSLLIFTPQMKPTPQELMKIRVDMILEAPVAATRILQVLGKMLGHDEAQLLDRLSKASQVEGSQKPQVSAVGGKFLSEEEAILVRGGSDAIVPSEAASESASKAPFNKSPLNTSENLTDSSSNSDKEVVSGSDRAQLKSDDSSVSNYEDKEKSEFRFGERMRVADVDEPSFETSEEAFPDVDLKALERELMGGGSPEVERVELPSEDLDLSVLDKELARAELRQAQEKLSEKMKKYSALVSEVKVSSRSTVTRVEARRRQKALAAEWSVENINELDELRREFTKALFKK